MEQRIMETALKLIKEYGINAVLALALVWMNTRVTRVEDLLFECYEARIIETKLNANSESITDCCKQYAILVREPKIKRKKA